MNLLKKLFGPAQLQSRTHERLVELWKPGRSDHATVVLDRTSFDDLVSFKAPRKAPQDDSLERRSDGKWTWRLIPIDVIDGPNHIEIRYESNPRSA